MKAIETEFDGYRFRSRLEARWAVFFHVAGIPYEYEPEGYELPSGKYLPDFYLPWFKCYVEIKPNEQDAIEKGQRCCRELRDILTDKVTMLCIGQPSDNNIRLYGYTYDDSGGGVDEYGNAYFLEGVWWSDEIHEFGGSKHWVNIIINEPRIDRSFSTQDGHYCGVRSIFEGFMLPYDDEPVRSTIMSWRSEFDHAKRIAKQARFEHGENPLKDEYNLDYDRKPLENNFSCFLDLSKKNLYKDKPCPYCGKKDLFACHELEDDGSTYYQMGCSNCNRYFTGKDCNEQWNHRDCDGKFLVGQEPHEAGNYD